MDLIAEKRKGEEGNYGVITLDGLERFTQKGLTEETVIAANEHLTNAYKHVVTSYGFEDFHSLYLFALSNTQKETLKYDSGTPKDYSSMNKVKRTVTRNGKKTEISFYESPKGLDNKQKTKSKPKTDGPAEQTKDLDMLRILAKGNMDEPIPIAELQAVQNIMDGFIVEGDFDDLDRVKMYVDEHMTPKAIQGLRVEGEYLTMPFIAYESDVQGFYQRAFFELVKVALNWDLGVAVKNNDTNIQKILVETSELKEVAGNYIATYDELLEVYGELP